MKKVAVVLSTVLLAFLILCISVFRSSSVNAIDTYSASPTPQSKEDLKEGKIEIGYVLPYPGRVLPDSPIWFMKALRDKVWIGSTTNTMRKAELSLLFA